MTVILTYIMGLFDAVVSGVSVRAAPFDWLGFVTFAGAAGPAAEVNPPSV